MKTNSVWILLVGLALATSGNSQMRIDSTVVGDWEGAIHIQSVELKILTHFTSNGATIDIPQQGATGLPLKNVSAGDGAIHFELPAGPGLAVFDGQFAGDSMGGSFTQAGAAGTFNLLRVELERSSAAGGDEPRSGEAVSIETALGTVHGTLLFPESAPPFSAVLLVAGSGPTDRDGNTIVLPGRNNSLRYLAEALQSRGIATLRYDKRGVGESSVRMPETDLRVDTFAVDVVAFARVLESDKRIGSIFLAGHSEGSLLVSLAAGWTDVDGVITIAGAGRPATVVLREQLAPQLPPDLMAEADTLMALLTRGEQTQSVSPSLASLFRPSVQPYLISWFAVDPAAVLGAVKKPKLILQGDTDIQVSVEDAERLAEFSPDATLKVIPGMNHVLKEVDSDRANQVASYSNPELPIDSDLVNEIVRFVKEVSGQNH